MRADLRVVALCVLDFTDLEGLGEGFVVSLADWSFSEKGEEESPSKGLMARDFYWLCVSLWPFLEEEYETA